MIRFDFAISEMEECQSGKLPENAVKIETPQTMEETMKKSSPIAVVLCFFLGISMFAKTFINKTMVISPVYIFVGVVIGFVLLIVHELLHAVVYPEEAVVTVGRLKGKMSFVALASYPLKRSRFILMSLLPFILGVVPLVIFLISPAEYKAFNGLMFGMACMGMISPFPDVYNVVTVLRKSEKDDKIMFYKDDMYKIGIK